jgi:hypothetical protein
MELSKMYLKYSLGFLVASLVQAGVVALTESMNISSLNVHMTFSQLLIHVIAGQAAGYILLFAMRKIGFIRGASTLPVGIIWGMLVWAIIIPINSAQGKINAPWSNTATLLSSMIAFILYGIISAYTIKVVDTKKLAV